MSKVLWSVLALWCIDTDYRVRVSGMTRQNRSPARDRVLVPVLRSTSPLPQPAWQIVRGLETVYKSRWPTNFVFLRLWAELCLLCRNAYVMQQVCPAARTTSARSPLTPWGSVVCLGSVLSLIIWSRLHVCLLALCQLMPLAAWRHKWLRRRIII